MESKVLGNLLLITINFWTVCTKCFPLIILFLFTVYPLIQQCFTFLFKMYQSNTFQANWSGRKKKMKISQGQGIYHHSIHWHRCFSKEIPLLRQRCQLTRMPNSFTQFLPIPIKSNVKVSYLKLILSSHVCSKLFQQL